MSDEVVQIIAEVLDRPSVYMGGPSLPSVHRAKEIVEQLAYRDYKIVLYGGEDVW